MKIDIHLIFSLISAEPDLARVLSILRATSPTQLDIPTLYEEAKKSFLDLFPKDPQQLAKFHCEHAEEAMALTIQNDILPVSVKRCFELSC